MASGDAEPNADLWAAPDETSDDIVALYRSAWEFADATIDELPLEAVGRVRWWGDGTVTLHRVLVHVTAETQRHAGHADIIRELIDGSAGLLNGLDNLRIGDRAPWARLPRPDRRRRPVSPPATDYFEPSRANAMRVSSP